MNAYLLWYCLPIVCHDFFTATTESFAISAVIPLPHHRGRIESETEKQTGKCCSRSWPKWNNQTCNGEEELGFGRVHRTGLETLTVKSSARFSLERTLMKVWVFHVYFFVSKPRPWSKQSSELCVSSVSRQMQKAYLITVWLMFQFPDLVLIKRK